MRSLLLAIEMPLIVGLMGGSCENPNPDPKDQTPPGMLFTVQLNRPGTPSSGLEIPAAGASRTIPQDTRMHLQGLGTDPESGIIQIVLRGDVTKFCELPGDLGQKRVATVRVVQPPTPPATPPVNAMGIGLELGFDYVKCSGADARPTSMSGDLEIIATNFAGLNTQSGKWHFDYRF